MNRVLEELLASSRLTRHRIPRHARRRVLEALDSGRRAPAGREDDDYRTVRLVSSDVEVLRDKDFEQMSGAELREAARMLERFRFPARDVETRRWRSVTRGGDVDLRRTVRASLRSGGGSIPLQWRRRRVRPPVVVALCDISGSMAGYSRMLLRFLHALSNDRERVHTFLFGTRLTNVTRQISRRDVDAALFDLGTRVRDWEGGTRIGACLADFNRTWSRRVLAQGAVVLLITDGLDRGDAGSIDREMARLSRSARRLIWLNPLLRFAEFRPEARGIREMLPHVDDFRPAHSIDSLEGLAQALADPPRTVRPLSSASAEESAQPAPKGSR